MLFSGKHQFAIREFQDQYSIEFIRQSRNRPARNSFLTRKRIKSDSHTLMSDREISETSLSSNLYHFPEDGFLQTAVSVRYNDRDLI